jgi:hypothetical protein
MREPGRFGWDELSKSDSLAPSGYPIFGRLVCNVGRQISGQKEMSRLPPVSQKPSDLLGIPLIPKLGHSRVTGALALASRLDGSAARSR